ncbi:Uncharacterised protein [uncultured archaeon]|nr:Uncharacterised protein [uncultured archaeon]
MLRKNVSISDTHLRLLDPLLKKHHGNLSAAMRDIIDFTGFVTENMGSLETAKDLLKEKNHAKEATLHRIYGVTIPLTMFQWLLANRNRCLPSLNDAAQLFATHNVDIYDVNNLNKNLNEELALLNWPVTVTVSSEDAQLAIQVTGMDREINKFSVMIIAMFFANNKNPQKISKLLLYPASIYMQVSKASGHEEAMLSIYEKFSEDTEKISGLNELISIHGIDPCILKSGE